MNTKVYYINDDGDALYLFDNRRTIFTELEGVDGLTSTLTTSQGYKQDGKTLDYAQLDERTMNLKFICKGRTHEEFLRTRESINRAFKPNLPGTLYYADGLHDVFIKTIPSKTAKIPKTGKKLMDTCEIELIANNPLFVDREKNLVDMNSWVGGLKLKSKGPFKLRHRGSPTKTIVNDGHVPVPFVCEFVGPATSPMIRDMKSGLFIHVNKTLEADDILTINTDYDKKSVTITRAGVTANAYNYIDLASTFFYLPTGETPMKYTSADINQKNQVNVWFRRAYGGL